MPLGAPPMSAAVSIATIPLAPTRAPARRDLVPILLTAPLILYMLVFYALPVAAMLLRSVDSPHWSLENYRQLTQDPVFYQVFWITLRTTLIVTVGTLLLGYPVALALAHLGRGLSAVVLILVLLPFWTSVLV